MFAELLNNPKLAQFLEQASRVLEQLTEKLHIQELLGRHGLTIVALLFIVLAIFMWLRSRSRRSTEDALVVEDERLNEGDTVESEADADEDGGDKTDKFVAPVGEVEFLPETSGPKKEDGGAAEEDPNDFQAKDGVFADDFSAAEISQKFDAFIAPLEAVPGTEEGEPPEPVEADIQPKNLEIIFKSLTELIADRELMLNPNGLFLRLENPARLGAVFKINVSLTGGKRLVEGEGEVVQVKTPKAAEEDKTGPGMQLRFIKLSRASDKFLQVLQEKRG